MPSFGPEDFALVSLPNRERSDRNHRGASTARRGRTTAGAAVVCEALEGRQFLSATPTPIRALPRGLATNPTASITTRAAQVGAVWSFTVTYRDTVGIDVTTIDDLDVRVVGAAYDQLATLIGLPVVNLVDNSVAATYTVPNPTTTGLFLIYMEPREVADTDGNFVVNGTPPLTPLGSFTVNPPGSGGGGGIDLPPSSKADLVATLLEEPISVVAGTRGSLKVSVNNRGDEKVRGKTRLALYASLDETVDTLDTRITSIDIGTFFLGQTRTKDLKFDWPQLNGNFFLIAKADDTNVVVEQFEFNNVDATENTVAIGPPFIDVLADVPSDQTDPVTGAVLDTQPLPTSALIGSRQKVRVEVTNRGNIQFPRPAAVALFLSADQTLDASDVPVSALNGNIGRLGANRTKVLNMQFDVPATLAQGPYFVMAKADAGGIGGAGVLVEPDEANNVDPSPYAVQFNKPFVDLLGTTINVTTAGPGALTPGDNQITMTVQNNGNVPATGPLGVTVYAAAGQVPAPGDVVLFRTTRNVNIAPGGSVNVVVNFVLPSQLTTGSFFLRGSIDTLNRFAEANETNNEIFSVFPFQIL